MAFPICELCKKKAATVHLTDIRDHEYREHHFCEACAEKQKLALKPDVSLGDLLAGTAQAVEGKKPKEKPDLACQHCGLKFREFQKRGRLGCAHDYQSFAPELIPLIERIHSRTAHTGKAFHESGEAAAQRRELVTLSAQLKSAVEREAYEEAAALRERIDTLKKGSPS